MPLAKNITQATQVVVGHWRIVSAKIANTHAQVEIEGYVNKAAFLAGADPVVKRHVMVDGMGAANNAYRNAVENRLKAIAQAEIDLSGATDD